MKPWKPKTAEPVGSAKPSPRRLVFVAFETFALLMPAAIIINLLLGWRGAIADSFVKALIHPFYFGLVGLILWIMKYMFEEPEYSRFGLGTILCIFIIFWLATPIISS